MVKYEKYQTAKITGTYKDENENEVAPTDPKVYIYDPDGTVLIDGTTPGFSGQTGIYYYYWDTSTLTVYGNYRVRWEGKIGGKLVSNSEYVEIVETITGENPEET